MNIEQVHETALQLASMAALYKNLEFRLHPDDNMLSDIASQMTDVYETLPNQPGKPLSISELLSIPSVNRRIG